MKLSARQPKPKNPEAVLPALAAKIRVSNQKNSNFLDQTRKRNVSSKKKENSNPRLNDNKNDASRLIDHHPSAVSASNQISKATDFINSVIHEYLLKKEYTRTLQAFQEEIEEKLKTKVYYLTMFSQEYNDKALLQHLASGSKHDFFTLFSSLFPIHVRKREESIQRIEFLLQLYFTVLPLYNSGEVFIKQKKDYKADQLYNSRLVEFKHYLEVNAGNFKSNEFIPYFALPYITDLRDNPAFRHLFEPSWSKGLKNDLAGIIKRFIPLGPAPLLYEVFSIYNQTVDNTKNIIINQITNLKQDKDNDGEKVNELLVALNKSKKKEEGARQMLVQSQIKWNRLAIEINSNAAELLSAIKNMRLNPISSTFVETQALKLNKYDFFLKKLVAEFDKVNTGTAGNQKADESVLWGNNISFLGKTNKQQHNVSNNNLNNQSELVNFAANSTHMEPQGQILGALNESEEGINESDEASQDVELQGEKEFIAIEDQPPKKRKENSLINSKGNLSRIQNKINEQELNFNSQYLLDMSLIKEEIGKLGSATRHSMDYRRISFILKEIRFRIIKKRHSAVKMQTVNSIYYYDLFSMRSKFVDLLKNLFQNSSTLEETVKLLNTLSTTSHGRDYLLSRPTIIEDLIQVLKSQETDNVIRQNCLGILQKFTLRSSPQKKMIELNLLDWCISTLTTEKSIISSYTVEYCLALIMNLSLSNKGREKCISSISPTMKLISEFLDSESMHIKTCVHGLLFSLLKKKPVKEVICVNGIKERLEKTSAEITDSNDPIRKQIEYILLEIPKEEEPDTQIEEEYVDGGLDDLEEVYEDDCNLNDTLSIVTNVNFSSEETRHLHNKSVEYFILKFETDNIEEIKKLNEFTHSLIKQKKKNLRVQKENQAVEKQRPLSRPITPLQNRDTSKLTSAVRKIEIKEQSRVNEDQEKNLKRQETKKKSISNFKENLENSELEDREERENEENKIGESSLTNKQNKEKIQKGYTFNLDNLKEGEPGKTKIAFTTNNVINRTPDQTLFGYH